MDPQLKERLAGAIVLVCVAVIVVPMILSGPDEADSGSASLPSAGTAKSDAGTEFSSRVVPIEGRPAASAAPPAKSAARSEPRPGTESRAEKAPLAAPSAAPVPAPVKTLATPQPARTRPPKPAGPPAKRGAPVRGWVVQLGSFSNQRNAEGLEDRLRAKGYRVFLESSERDGARIARVFVGPEKDRAAADDALARLFKDTGLKGIVVRRDD